MKTLSIQLKNLQKGDWLNIGSINKHSAIFGVGDNKADYAEEEVVKEVVHDAYGQGGRIIFLSGRTFNYVRGSLFTPIKRTS